MRTHLSAATLVSVLCLIVESRVDHRVRAASTDPETAVLQQRDVMRTFQLGNHSYELSRVNRYEVNTDSGECNGHRASHADKVMKNIENNCGNLTLLTYPAQTTATQLLREGNYFDCGREQIRVDVVDSNDLGQSCVMDYINANNQVWFNGSSNNQLCMVTLLLSLLLVSILTQI